MTSVEMNENRINRIDFPRLPSSAGGRGTPLAEREFAMRKLRRCLAVSAWAIAIVELLSGCAAQRSGKLAVVPPASGGASGQAGPQPVQPGAGAPGMAGTSDTGGCSGADGDAKCFDSYIVDPTKQLPAYLTHVAPMLAKIKQPDGQPHGSGLEMWLTAKTWYVAPVDLASIEKKSLGVGFIRSGTRSIGIQTRRAIWFDKRIWDTMSASDQGDAIVHELVMANFISRFSSIPEILRMFEQSGFQTWERPPTAEDLEYLNQAHPAMPIRNLDEDDNESIRKLVGLIRLRSEIPHADWVRAMRANDADVRFFDLARVGGEAEATQLPNRKVSKAELLGAIRAAILTGRAPSVCRAVNLRRERPCRVDLKMAVPTRLFGAEFTGDELTVHAGDKVVGKTAFLSSMEELTLYNLGGEAGTWMYSLIDGEPEIGAPVWVSTLVFRFLSEGDRRRLVFKSWVLKPYVMTAYRPDGPGFRCEAEPIQPKSFETDAIFISAPGAKAEYGERVALGDNSQGAPMRFCTDPASATN